MKLSALFSLIFAATSSHAFVVSPNKGPVTRPEPLQASSVPTLGFKDIKQKFMPSKHVTLEPNLDLACCLAIAGSVLSYGFHQDILDVATLGAFSHLTLGAWVGVQTNRVRCVFEEDALEFYNLKGASSGHLIKENYAAEIDPTLEHKSPNWMTRTANRWNYETITGYRFYPSIEFPVICILWETETAGAKDSKVMRQPHFFPVLFDAKEFKAEMDKRGVNYDEMLGFQ